MNLRRATERLREVRSLPLLLLALLLAASGDLSAQDRSRSRANDSSDSGRVAVPRSESGSSHSSPPPSSPPRSASPSSPSDSPSASPSSPSRRYAVPGTPGESHRQPPSRDRYDGRHGGGGRSYGSHYYPRWYGYYGGPGWWWSPYGSWGWWWLGDNYWPYGPYYGGGYYDHGDRYDDRDAAGALDLDISPGRTQVYLDGQYLGIVDQYDGWPTYLWLEKGTYDVVFYLDGYKTLARQVTIYPGTVVDFDDRLEPGASTRPEDIPTKTHERRDARLRFEEERRQRIERGEAPNDAESDESWRDRVRRDREDRRDTGEEVEIQDQGSRPEQARVRVAVEPDDASVYLDGHFVGTAQDLANLRRGLLVEPGKHTVAVVRPGRESAEKEFEVQPGEEYELELELETSGE